MQARPRVAGDLVVFEDYGEGDPDIFGYRIDDGGLTFRIAHREGPQITPDVAGDWVVWVETIAPGDDQIVAYDTLSGTQRILTTVASNKLQPRISGTRVQKGCRER